jgi:hypothetical protein
MSTIYRRSLKPLNLDWHFKPQCPHWPQADFFQADYVDPESGDNICGDCIKINSQNTPAEKPRNDLATY